MSKNWVSRGLFISLNQINLLSLFVDPLGTLLVIGALTVNQIEEPLQARLTEALFQDVDKTKVLQSDGLGKDVKVSYCQLRKC